MAWVYLAIAGALEIGWAIGLKYSTNLSNGIAMLLTVVAMNASFVFLALAARQMQIGTCYAIWTGIGAVGTAALGIILFSESTAWPRLFFLGLIVAGIVGLKLNSGS